MRFVQWQNPLCRHFAAELIFAAEKSNKKPDHIGRAFCYFGSSPNTRVIPSIVISHVLPDCRASFVWKRAGAFLYPVHACRTVMTAFPQRFAASVTVITSSSALTSITSQAMQY